MLGRLLLLLLLTANFLLLIMMIKPDIVQIQKLMAELDTTNSTIKKLQLYFKLLLHKKKWKHFWRINLKKKMFYVRTYFYVHLPAEWKRSKNKLHHFHDHYQYHHHHHHHSSHHIIFIHQRELRRRKYDEELNWSSFHDENKSEVKYHKIICNNFKNNKQIFENEKE